MNQSNLQNLKGFRDYLPADALKRQFVVGKIISVFQKFGFDPLETPTLEYASTLEDKYGEEERLIYKFETQGGDKVALKYDQTVPLARVVAQYGPRGEQKLPIPFKRYQIQSAFRGENTQKGRYREFLQCDADIVGVSTALADAEILGLIYEIYSALGLDVIIKINDRSLLAEFEPKELAAVDKLNKIGEDGVIRELQEKGLSSEKAENVLKTIKETKPSPRLEETEALYLKLGYQKDSLKFDSTLIRGLDYYTGLIVEVVLKSDPNSSSLGGGGRWDSMIGKFTGLDIPAIGFSVGVDRTIEAMEVDGQIEIAPTNTKVLVTIFAKETIDQSIKITSQLRAKEISAEVWADPESKLDKQLKYADQKGIPCVIIVGPDEVKNQVVVLKNLKTGEQEKLTLDQVISKLSI